MTYVHEAECRAAGVSVVVVAKHAKKLEAILKAMKADGLMLFGGGDGSTIRPLSDDPMTALLMLAPVMASNLDGGAGGESYRNSKDGLRRGE
ncbi:hypothetical protein RYA05_03635 [Pseudomonas syringae pv. actinidiae]|nr:hypothetical protein [Pseudomonas syringae pv. actinidiae]